jgi:hypothetical protein
MQMTRYPQIFMLLAFVASTSFAADLKHEDWHKPVREYEPRDSVLVQVVDYALIQKIKVGMTFEEVKRLTHVEPVDYYIHPNYSILETKVGEDYYEVAFLHKKSHIVEAISYRKSPWTKEPNKSLQPPPGSR